MLGVYLGLGVILAGAGGLGMIDPEWGWTLLTSGGLGLVVGSVVKQVRG